MELDLDFSSRVSAFENFEFTFAGNWSSPWTKKSACVHREPLLKPHHTKAAKRRDYLRVCVARGLGLRQTAKRSEIGDASLTI